MIQVGDRGRPSGAALLRAFSLSIRGLPLSTLGNRQGGARSIAWRARPGTATPRPGASGAQLDGASVATGRVRYGAARRITLCLKSMIKAGTVGIRVFISRVQSVASSLNRGGTRSYCFY